MDTDPLAKQRFPMQCINCVLCLVSFQKLYQSVAFCEAALSIGIQHNGLDLPKVTEDFSNILLLGFFVNPRHKRHPAFDAP